MILALSNLYKHVSLASFSKQSDSRARILDKIHNSPILKETSGPNSRLRHMRLYHSDHGHEIYVKDEASNQVRSFKWRGALQLMHTLFADGKNKDKRGLAASAGNHAQGVALAAKKFGAYVTIVMPETADPVKIQRVKEIGGEFVTVILHGETFNDALKYTNTLKGEDPSYLFLHPFDDEDVIAGQGTLGIEIMRQFSPFGTPDVIAVPVGGGGLAAGVAIAIKAEYPGIKILAVEIQGTEKLAALFAGEGRITLDSVNPFAGGVAVKQLGDINAPIIRDLVDFHITVSQTEIAEAMQAILSDQFNITEPSGALALAGLSKWLGTQTEAPLRGVAVVSGGNVEKGFALRALDSANAIYDGAGNVTPEPPLSTSEKGPIASLHSS